MSQPPTKSHGRLSQSVRLQPSDLLDGPKRLKGAWTAKVLTLFPEVFPGVLGASLTGKALHQGLWALEPIGLRAFGTGKHRQVDDTPAGGGAGLVMKPDVMGRALDMAALGAPQDPARWPRVYLSPRGKPFTQADAERFSKAEGMTLICGRFEGLDQRVIDHYALEEISIGDYVLTGGEIAAQALLDATVRLIPGVLGNAESTQEESFANGLLEHPQYTKPADWRGHSIPSVLLSGDHGAVAAWRRSEAESLTQSRRPDLWAAHNARVAWASAAQKPPRLRTERLLLRPPKASDATSIAKILGDLSVSRWLERVPHPFGESDAHALLARIKEGRDRLVWAIEFEKRVIGMVGVGSGLEFWMAADLRGQGFMSEAAKAAVGAFFKIGTADGLKSLYIEGDERSSAVLDSLGFGEIETGATFSVSRQTEVQCHHMVLSRKTWVARST